MNKKSIEHRLLDIKQAAAYIGIGVTLFREYIGKEITPVLLRGRTGKHIQKLLFDRVDLDRLIEGLKEKCQEGKEQQTVKAVSTDRKTVIHGISNTRGRLSQQGKQIETKQSLTVDSFCQKWGGAYQ